MSLDGSGLVRTTVSDGADVLLSPDAVLALISATVNPTMAALPEDNGPLDPMEYGPEAYTHDLKDCIVQELAAFLPKHHLIRVDCENGEYSVISYGIYLTIRYETD